MYDILNYSKQKANQLGVSIKPSTNPKKKIDVFKNSKKICSIGANGMMDYPHYIQEKGSVYANQRKKLYHLRHQNEGICGNYAKKILW